MSHSHGLDSDASTVARIVVFRFYCFRTHALLRTIALGHPATSLSVSGLPDATLAAIGTSGHLVELVDYESAHFQDFEGHADAVDAVGFAPGGARLVSGGRGSMCVWRVDTDRV